MLLRLPENQRDQTDLKEKPNEKYKRDMARQSITWPAHKKARWQSR